MAKARKEGVRLFFGGKCSIFNFSMLNTQRQAALSFLQGGWLHVKNDTC
jgi:hypothetical protein